MEKRSGLDAVRNFWEQVWQSPQDYDAIDDLVVEAFVFISGGRRIEGREAFKKWAEDFGAAIGNMELHIFITDPDVKDDYNRSLPSADVPRFSRIVADALPRIIEMAGSTDDPAAYAQRVVERLFPTTLPYVPDSAASFGFAGFNGRAMTDNVENVMLSLQSNTPIDQGASVARTNILDEFPYFGTPHADPSVD
jgi:hypothetical protein